jgi:hypothetical protein
LHKPALDRALGEPPHVDAEGLGNCTGSVENGHSVIVTLFSPNSWKSALRASQCAARPRGELLVAGDAVKRDLVAAAQARGNT